MARGGSFINNRRNCRAAYRNRNDPDNFNNNVGFLVARSTFLNLLTLAQYEHAAALLTEIGKLLGGWQKVHNA